jgi:hypothetical protein
MNIMNGINNFLRFLNDNWTSIVVCVGLLVGLYRKIKTFILKTDAEKIEIAKTQVSQTILKLITNAELDFEDWNSAGAIKRSQVITEIYNRYPILNKVLEQDEVIEWIDTLIVEALDELKVITSENDSGVEDDVEDDEDEVENEAKG